MFDDDDDDGDDNNYNVIDMYGANFNNLPCTVSCRVLLLKCLQRTSSKLVSFLRQQQNNSVVLPGNLYLTDIKSPRSKCYAKPQSHEARLCFVYIHVYITVHSGDVWPDRCQNAEWPERRPTGLTTMSHCQVIVSRMARVSIAAHAAIFGGRHSVRSTLRPWPTACANVDAAHVLFHGRDSSGHAGPRYYHRTNGRAGLAAAWPLTFVEPGR